MKIVVLGAGLVGSAIAKDLSENEKFEVVSVDFDQKALNGFEGYSIDTIQSDLSIAKNVEEVIRDSDLVVGAVPGGMGFNTVKEVIKSGKNIVDISFFPEDLFELDDLAKKHGVTAIVDCGVAPGMGNIILGHHDSDLNVKSYKCYVGGLPVERQWPYEYKAVFSPFDVIEEYIRPARYIQNGKQVIREALSETELMSFDGVGTLEAWNSDGLRSLLKTMSHIPDLLEKTLRYPGCVEYLKVLRASGFFSYDEIDVKGVKVRPVDVTAKLLFPLWKLGEGEKEFTVMKIIIEGEKHGKKQRIQWDILDHFDVENKITSMARTTGYTCNAAVNLLANGKFEKKGIIPPEYLGRDRDNFKFIVDYLKERGVNYRQTSEEV